MSFAETSDRGLPSPDQPRTIVPIHFDLLTNPYGPSIAVQETLAMDEWRTTAPSVLLAGLKRRIALDSGMPDAFLHIGRGADSIIKHLLSESATNQPVVLFPPQNPGLTQLVEAAEHEIIEERRSRQFDPAIDLETASELPRDAIAIVEAPNNPAGAPLHPRDAVRLSRACALLVIDERHGGYGPRSLADLTREFNNIVVIRSLETWAALEEFPVAWAVASPSCARHWLSDLAPPDRESLTAGLATFDDLRYLRFTTRRVQEERARLFRFIRKLNYLQPSRSWANFLLARATRGDAGQIQMLLADRGMIVDRPVDPGLPNHLRISARRPEDTDVLKTALIEIAGLV